MSSLNPDERGSRLRVALKIEAHDADGNLIGTYENPDDLATIQMAQLVQLNIFDTAESVQDITNTTRSLTANSAATAPTIYAGTGTTAAAYNDYYLQTETESTTSITVNAASGSGVSSNFTVTGTITAGANRAYAEVGMSVTIGGHAFLITHDVFAVLNVSSGGTLAVTYTFTFS